jgi:hypothetical protein
MSDTSEAASREPAAEPGVPNTFTIRPARYAELPAIAAALTAAFWEDELFGNIIHPRRKEFPKDNELYWLRRARVNWWDWSQRYLVAVVKDAEGRDVIAGAALWARIGERAPSGMRLAWADPRMWLPFSRTFFADGEEG